MSADVLAVGLASPQHGENEPQPRAGVADAAKHFGVDLAAVCAQESFTGRAGEVLAVPVGALPAARNRPESPKRLLLVGVGDESARDLRRAGAAVGRATRGVERLATTVGCEGGAGRARSFVEGLLLGSYSPPRHGMTEGPKPPVADVRLLGSTDDAADAALTEAVTAAKATWLVRDLANTPSSTKNPGWMAERVRELAAGLPGLSVEVLDAGTLRKRGFGGLVAVGSGSATPPCLVSVSYTPERGTARRAAAPEHVVLVGKGITFDTGGLSIKPREAMVPMKTDMAGSAVVLAAVVGAAQLRLATRVTALLPLAENAFGAASYRPGDIVTVYGGTTVEIKNTDAEGRMVLADALAYADQHLEPDVLVDVATLTGAASLGLGRRHGALYTADDSLAAAFTQAAALTGERVWRMPLVEEYRTALDSDVADICHVVEDKKVSGGSITAALFLREFVGTRRWAHLDIAGPARADSDEHEVSKGASGYGARLLLEWLRSLSV
ncbi:MAG TPA: leucyl aminopeptidase family protein [Actinomycetales bacterium]|nr:leucyl aminopeptidase family protein [Actinomycetales bacterium]